MCRIFLRLDQQSSQIESLKNQLTLKSAALISIEKKSEATPPLKEPSLTSTQKNTLKTTSGMSTKHESANPSKPASMPTAKKKTLPPIDAPKILRVSKKR